MKINVWYIMNTIFYWIAFIASFLIVLKTDWKSLKPLEVLYICGAFGGIMYLGEFFKKERDLDYSVRNSKQRSKDE